MSDRPSAAATARVLSAGSLIAAALFVGSFALSVAGMRAESALVATTALVVLLATPAVGLVASALELRGFQPRVAGLAVIVLLILGAATLVAFAAGQ